MPSNVVATPVGRPGQISVTYDLFDADSDSVAVTAFLIRDDNMGDFLWCRSVTGDIGRVAPGNGRQFTWDAYADLPGYTGNFCQIGLVADDGIEEFVGWVSMQSTDPQFGNVMFHVDGTTIAMPADPAATTLVINPHPAALPDGTHALTLYYNADGLPEMAIYDGYILVLGNYTSTTVDAAMITLDDTIEYALGFDWSGLFTGGSAPVAKALPDAVSDRLFLLVNGAKIVKAIIYAVWPATWPQSLDESTDVILNSVGRVHTAFQPSAAPYYTAFGALKSCWITDPGAIAECLGGKAVDEAGKAVFVWVAGEALKEAKQAQIQEAQGGTCPTFIQPPRGAQLASFPPMDLAERDLVAHISIPTDGCLLRSDIPIYGYAGGPNFTGFEVQIGRGASPTEWTVIQHSSEPAMDCPDILDLSWLQGDIDLRGNLATWNSGLTNWEHLPWHSFDDPIDYKGTYTIRLLVTGHDGAVAEDRVVCKVGNVIAQCLPGKVTSQDGAVAMSFEAHSLPNAFRVYVPECVPDAQAPHPDSDWTACSPIYDLLPHGDEFTQPVELTIRSAVVGLDPAASYRVMWYDTERQVWDPWQTTFDARAGSGSAMITGIPQNLGGMGLFRWNGPLVDCPSAVAESRLAEEIEVLATGPVLYACDFEQGIGSWSGLARRFGASVEIQRGGGPDGGDCLVVTNKEAGGNSAARAFGVPYNVRDYPILEFDYRADPDLSLDIYVRSGQRWFAIGFADSPNRFVYSDVGIRRIGQVPDVRLDRQWHHARISLADLMRSSTATTSVDEIVLADWDVTGFMKLAFGNMPQGAWLAIDNFAIRRTGRDAPPPEVTAWSLDDFAECEPGYKVFASGDFSAVTCEEPAGSTDEFGRLKMQFALAGRDEFGVVYYLIPPGSLADSWAVEIKAAGDLEHLWAGFGPFAAEKKIPLRGLVRSLPDTHHALITIPLVAFGPGRLTDDDRLVFSLAVQPGSGSARGVINVENIDFVQSPSRLFVDGFEGDDPAINALGLATGTFSSGAAAVAVRRARGGDASIKSPTCSLLSYGGSIGTNLGVDGFSYAGWYTEVGGGDFREASEIAFDVRGVEGGESFHVYLSDGNVRRRVAVPGERIRRELWTRCRIPLVQFGEQGVDLGHIERVEIVFEWEPTSGAIYIDNLAFEETQETVLTRVRPPAADADPRQR